MRQGDLRGEIAKALRRRCNSGAPHHRGRTCPGSPEAAGRRRQLDPAETPADRAASETIPAIVRRSRLRSASAVCARAAKAAHPPAPSSSLMETRFAGLSIR